MSIWSTSEASTLLSVPYRICSRPLDEKKRASGAGNVNVVFVQTQPVAKLLFPSEIHELVAGSSTWNVQSCVVRDGPR